ncbi:MAG: YihA family ribosome biogenesis GTP-binding protein [Sphingomonas sp.]|nr:YihA family ribosome biogenesis GTP-binding protein [Sphingomonas sp.]RZV51604.1 MAG: YihA family ribosome biogenesis GTP-binding protein [Sphingomonadaceae bacterium]
MTREETARKLLTGRVEFLLSAPQLKFLPDPIAPEVAFAGRSNVGKSSLLNALTGRKKLARASVTPGRTQELNFFEVGDPLALRLVDMPGYGFAKAPVNVVRKWRNLVESYLKGRAALQRCFLLIDSRRGIMDVDREMMKMMDGAAITYQIVLTKTDKVKAKEKAKIEEAVAAEAKKHPAAFPELIVTSAEKGYGMEELRTAVLDAIDPEGTAT